MGKRILILFVLASVPLPQAFALVDYTEEGEEAFASGDSSDLSPSPSLGRFYSNVGHRQTRVDLENSRARVDFLDFSGHFETRYNFYLNLHYWMAHSNSQALVGTETGYQKGNPTVILGFNWLEVGDARERVTLGFTTGMSFGLKDSALASSRDDRHFGVVTKKRFGPIILGLNYILTLTGAPRREEEMAIGSIRMAQAFLGWNPGAYRFLLETGTYTVEPPGGNRNPRLREKVSFGYLSPKAIVNFGGLLNLEFGAIFRTKRNKEYSLASANLWDLRGAYGNSFFGGINLSL